MSYDDGVWHSELQFFFFALPIIQYSKNNRNNILETVQPQVKGETSAVLGPLERLNLNPVYYVLFRIRDDGQGPRNPTILSPKGMLTVYNVFIVFLLTYLPES
jgi:hypothetical protein